jgi:mannan endo-1,4-beta-mannosidase
LREATALIRSLDANHLISIGNEGTMGCEGDISLYDAIHADPNVDYLTIHIWPKNWGWILPSRNLSDDIGHAIDRTNRYVDEHLAIAEKWQKPLVIEEFGFPREAFQYAPSAPTTHRDRYYENIFSRIAESAENKGRLSGCNAWSWGGFGRPAHEYWQPWDDYLGDPSQEEQGLNSVFDTDATTLLISRYAKENHFLTE